MKLTDWLIRRVIEEDGARTRDEIHKAIQARGHTDVSKDAVDRMTREMTRRGQLADDERAHDDTRPGQPPKRFRLWCSPLLVLGLLLGLGLLAACAEPCCIQPTTPTATPVPALPAAPALAGAPSPACGVSLYQPNDSEMLWLVARVAGCPGLVLVHQSDPSLLMIVSAETLTAGGIPADVIAGLPEQEMGR